MNVVSTRFWPSRAKEFLRSLNRQTPFELANNRELERYQNRKAGKPAKRVKAGTKASTGSKGHKSAAAGKAVS